MPGMDKTHTAKALIGQIVRANALGRRWAARPDGCWVRRAATLTLAALALVSGAKVCAQEAQGGRQVSQFLPASALAEPRRDLASRLEALKTQRLNQAVERAVPAPRVAAVVHEILPPDVQVVVVPGAPSGLASYHPGLVLSGYAHVHASHGEPQVLGSRRGVIIVDARLEELASRETIAFVLAHEYARQHLDRGHTAIDADAFARAALVQMGLWSPRAVERAFALAQGQGWGGSSPSTAEARMRALGLGGPGQVLALAAVSR